MEDRNPALCKAFVESVTAMLAWAPHVKHELSVDDDEDHCVLHIPKADENGFEITIEVGWDDITIWTEGGHFHLDPDPPYVETAQSLVNLLRRLLSPEMRVRELLTRGRPYRWYLESLVNGKWHAIQTTGMWFIISFGRRSERIYQNRMLEGDCSTG